MNIFFLSRHPRRCARWHCDKHVVKMILESCQMLYTAHHVHGGTVIVESSAPVCASTGRRGYKKHAAKHPSTLWVCASLAHYLWLCAMAMYLVDEHEYRFHPSKRHACEVHLKWLRLHPPPGLCAETRWLSDPNLAMPDEFKISSDAVECYRAYYSGSKRERGLFKWTGRHIPHVF